MGVSRDAVVGTGGNWHDVVAGGGRGGGGRGWGRRVTWEKRKRLLGWTTAHNSTT